MKRIGSVLALATLFLATTALPALARYAPPPPQPGGNHGTAFTGANISVGLVVLVGLVVVGLVALVIGRRAAAHR